jgi:S-methylmethionine-dependent homocysteine/selenocysteine methylase
MTTKITIMDGGMGRQLQAMGAPFKQPEWSALALMEAPDTVRQAHQSFINAGAQIITTNSYALVPFHIGQDVFDAQAPDLIRDSVSLAHQAKNDAPHKVKIAGCLPPAFGSYRPDLFDIQNARDIYAPLIEHQLSGIDFWLAETMSSTAEAQLLIEMTKDRGKDLWISYSLNDEEEGKLRSGESIEQSIETALGGNAAAILFNCSQPEAITPALEILQKNKISIPYGAYANSFTPINRMKDTNKNQANAGLTPLREDITPEEYLAFAQKWKDLGATLIGGCCGIGPEHIGILAQLND